MYPTFRFSCGLTLSNPLRLLQEFFKAVASPFLLWTSENLIDTMSPAQHSPMDLPPPIYPWLEHIQNGATSLAVCKQPNRGHHHSKVTPTPERGMEIINTHQSNCSFRSGKGTDFGWGYRRCPPMKASQETTQRKHPATQCYCISGKWLFYPNSSLRQPQTDN